MRALLRAKANGTAAAEAKAGQKMNDDRKLYIFSYPLCM